MWLFLTVMLLSLSYLKAQPEKFELIGTLKTADQLIPLKVNIEVEADGKVSGISSTNFLNADKTESRIEGTVDFKNQLMNFAEVGNLSTNSNAQASEFCYIRVKDLKWRQSKEKSIFNGKFKGYYPDSTECASGEIYLVSMEVLRKLVEQNPQLQNIKDSLKQVAQATPIDTTLRVNTEEPLMHESVLALPWHSDEVKLHVWDAFKEDNDRIDIYINDSLVYNNVVATAHKKTFKFKLESQTANSIKIVALNEGEQPPNTVNAQLIDGGKVHPLVTKLKTDEFVEVQLIKAAK